MNKRMMFCVGIAIVLVFISGVAWGQRSSAAAPPYSPARRAGQTVYLAGQVARTPAGQEVRGSIEAETRQVMENLGRVLKENGCSFEDVMNVTVYLADINDYAAMNKVYAGYFPKAYPARACVGGLSLVSGFKVEISAVACKTSS